MIRRRLGSRAGQATIVLLAAGVGGCAVGPDYHPPATQMPASWAQPVTPATQPTTAPTTRNSEAVAAPADVAEWWHALKDPALDSLIGRAVQSNLDLRVAGARLRQARASRGVASSGFWPNADVSGSYIRSGSEGNSTARVLPDGTVISNSSGGSRGLFRAGVDAAWELDVFGGIRRDIEAADADVAAAVEDRRDVLVTLTSEVALNYVDLRGFQRQIAIAQQNLKAQEYSGDLTRRRQRGGFVSSLDVANSDALVASTRSQIPILQQQERQTIYSLSVLLGQEPAALVKELTPVAPIPTVPTAVPVGLPSDLLRRRPDIRRAEAQLHAATSRIGVATADLFPRFNLAGSLGVQGTRGIDLANWNNGFWSFGPQISWPIFSAGRIQSNIAVQNAAEEQALLGYRATVLTALQDVETALVAFAQEQEHRKALLDAVAANRRAVELAQLLYTQGQTDFLNVLSAQRSLYGSEDSLVQSERTMAMNLISLYKAMGGGWEWETAQPVARK